LLDAVSEEVSRHTAGELQRADRQERPAEHGIIAPKLDDSQDDVERAEGNPKP
jgi:hypothetical protein